MNQTRTSAHEPDRQELERLLTPVEQQHVLAFWDELGAEERRRLAEQILSVDWHRLARLLVETERAVDWQVLASRAKSPPAIRLGRDRATSPTREEAVQAAEQLLREGRVGCVLVAGGQGTRLGFPHPKGMYPIGPVSGRTLFQMHFEQLRALAQRLGRGIPLYLMTSPATHNETVAFLDRHARFGLPAEDVRVFCQGTMPAMDERGKVLLSAKGELFLSPDGHGGMLAAWQQSGCLQDAIDRGLSQIFYFQVDNPLVRVADCELLGFHVLQGAEMSTQVIAKQDPMEKVGNVVQVDGRLMVIEYSDLPPEAARERNADGSLKFWAGSIAVHGFTVDFLRRSAALGDSLPWHRAKKKVPYVDATGRLVEPVEPNATKFERFIFDLMPHAARAVVVEADAAEVFAPVKNAPGEAKDTPETAQAAIIERARRWLAAAGVRPREGIAVEISPFVALNAQELAQRVRGSLCLNSDTYLTEAIICQRNVSNSGPELEK